MACIISACGTGCRRISSRIAPTLAHFTGLTSINLAYNRFINGSIANHLQHLQNLRYMNLMHCEGMSDDNLGDVGLLTQLHHLDLSGNVVSLLDLALGEASGCNELLHLAHKGCLSRPCKFNRARG